ncbi:hypothetical protein NMG60_11005746 [Bertholletia excelsa]
MGRAPCCDKANVKKGPWSPEEDAKLKAYIEKYGTGGNWIALPQKIGLKRCGKSCRLRWLNYLRPNIKHGGFSEEEDNIICNLYISIGSRWSIIAAQLPGRTDNDIKNYWNTRLKKKLLGRRKQTNMRTHQDPKDSKGSEENSSSPPQLSNSALERLQLHMQLQSLQSPLSPYNNPALWPKLHPLQEKLMIQNLQFLNPNLMRNLPPTPSPKPDNTPEQPTTSLGFPPQDYPSFTSSLKIDELENYLTTDSSIGFHPGSNPMPRPDGVAEPGSGMEPVSSFQVELEGLLNNKTSGLEQAQEDLMGELGCFAEMNGSWANGLNSKPATSNSWDSSSFMQSEGLYQDYALGYNLP